MATVAVEAPEGVHAYLPQLPIAAMQRDWLTTRQAGVVLDVSDRRARQLAGEGRVQAARLHGRWLLERGSLLAYGAERAKRGKRRRLPEV